MDSHGAGTRNVCLACGRAIPYQRAGVDLTPLKAAIFDAIKAAGDIGITSSEIIEVVYAGSRRQPGTFTIKAHVSQINSLLCATDTKIVSDRRRWFLYE